MTHKKLKNIKALPSNLRLKKVNKKRKLGSGFAQDVKQALKVGKRITKRRTKLRRPTLDFQ